MRRFVRVFFWQLISIHLATGCLGEPGVATCRESCSAGANGSAAGSGDREKSLRPPTSPLDGGCTCPVLPGCGVTDAPGDDSEGAPVDGGGAGQGPVTVVAGGGAVVDFGDDASSPVDEGEASGDGGTQGLAAPSRPGDVVITEIMPDPSAATDAAGEWVELHNPATAGALDLSGCELADDQGAEGSMEDALVVLPGGFAVVARSAEPGFSPDHVCPGLSLRNSGGDQVILRCDGVLIDRIAYAAVQPGRSLSLDPSLVDVQANDDPASWCTVEESYHGGDRGTPGRANPVCLP
jgi:hypothetical protein